MSLYWDDESLLVEPYERKQKKYDCGKVLKKTKKEKKNKFIVVIIDLSEGYCGK